MNVRPTRLVAVTALAVVALLGTSCSTGQPAGSAPPSTASALSAAPATGGAATGGAATGGPATGTGSPSSAAPGVSAEQVGRAHQAALGLVALGGLATQKGTTDAIRALADTVTAEGRAIDEQVRALAGGQGLGLTDALDVRIQRVVNDVAARSGVPFDQGWLRAVGELVTQGRDAANAVLSSSTASEADKTAARDALTRLDALAAAVRDATNAAGAGTPKAVDAGTGGQAAEAPILPVALVGLGALLLGSAVVLRRRRA